MHPAVQQASSHAATLTTAPSGPAALAFLPAHSAHAPEQLPLEERACRIWVAGLVQYAPTVDALALLVADGSPFRTQCSGLEEVVPLLSSKLRGYYFASAGELRALTKLMWETPGLRAPQLSYSLAASVLENVEADDFLDATLQLLVTALNAQQEGAASSSIVGGSASANHQETGAVASVVRAARSWLHRNFAQPPPPKKCWEASSGYGWSYSGSAHVGGRWVEERQTAEERQSQRESCLVEALERVQSLMGTSFFEARSSGIDALLYELGRCFFLQGSATSALQALCSVAVSEAEDGHAPITFHSYGASLQAWLQQKACDLVEAAVAAEQQSERVLRVICATGMRSLPLSGRLLHATCLAVGGERPALPCVLANRALWERVMEACSSSEGIAPLGGLYDILTHVTATLREVVAKLSNGALELRSLHTVLKAPTPLPQLLSSLRLPMMVDSSLLEVQQHGLTKFDRVLLELRAYCSYWCTCGMPIHADALRVLVSRLTRQYVGLTLADAETAFDDVEVLPHLSWLFSLRGSELFLRVWREAGHSAAQKRRLLEASEMEVAFAALAETLNLWEGVDEAEVSPSGESERGAPEEAGELEEEADEEPLTQALSVEHLLPEARWRWLELMAAVRDGGISVFALARAIGRLGDSQVSEELQLLSATGEGLTPPSHWLPPPPPWVATSTQHVRAFLRLRRLRCRLPDALALWRSLLVLCAEGEEEDALGARLRAQHKALEEQWSGLTLESVSAALEPLEVFFRNFDEAHLELLSLLAGAPRILTWLLDELQRSNDAFNRLLTVCRPNTDEPRLLSALAALSAVRTMLSRLIYPPVRFTSLLQLLEVLSQLETDGGLDHLRELSTSFDGLLHVFEKQSQSPGIKACHELYELSRGACLILRAHAAEGDTIMVRFPRATQAAAVLAIPSVSSPASSMRRDSQQSLPPGRQPSVRSAADVAAGVASTDVQRAKSEGEASSGAEEMAASRGTVGGGEHDAGQGMQGDGARNQTTREATPTGGGTGVGLEEAEDLHGGAISAGSSMREEPLEYLLDLRSKVCADVGQAWV